MQQKKTKKKTLHQVSSFFIYRSREVHIARDWISLQCGKDIEGKNHLERGGGWVWDIVMFTVTSDYLSLSALKMYDYIYYYIS